MTIQAKHEKAVANLKTQIEVMQSRIDVMKEAIEVKNELITVLKEQIEFYKIKLGKKEHESGEENA